MKKPRQDAWTKDEDVILAEIVLKYIGNGKTQLEAFKQAGEALLRTPAACGFRWNASVRKEYLDEIEQAKVTRKQLINTTTLNEVEQETIESAISMLEKMKDNVIGSKDKIHFLEQQDLIVQLQADNERLRLEMKRYREAWADMKLLWEWIETKNGNLHK